VTLTNDPRSPATNADVRAQYALLRKINDGVKAAWDGYQQADAMRTALKELTSSDSDVVKAIKAIRARLDSVAGNAGGMNGPGSRQPPPSFRGAHGRLIGQLTVQDNADQAPTEAMLASYDAACRDLDLAATKWAAINATERTALNAVLARTGIAPVPAAAGVTAPQCGAKRAR
jgi:hypothetical protein